MKLSTILTLSLCSLILFAAGCQQTPVNQTAAETDDQVSDQLVGGDRDEHNCIGSAGYRWCEPKQECLRFWETPCYDSPLEGIKYAFAEKYNKPVSDISLRIEKQTEEFARGTVEFAPGGSENSGMFLASQGNGIWLIAHDGNGAPDCTALKEQYNFQEDMLEGLCDK